MTATGENGDLMEGSFFSFHSTARGYNHIKSDSICEDNSGSFDGEDLHICVVADGHGSDNYPRTFKGSEFAVNTTIGSIKEFISDFSPDELTKDTEHTLLKKLSDDIHDKWCAAVEEDCINNPFTEEELANVSERYKAVYLGDEDKKKKKAYGTTLIAYVFWRNCAFGLQIGDGKCVVIDGNGDFLEPIPWDEKCSFNITTSLCDDDAKEEFRYHVSDKIPAAVFCGSDGIDDSYANDEELRALYRSMLTILGEYGRETFEKEIGEYLPVLTKKGSGDDVSVASIADIDRVKLLGPVLDLQAQMFKLEEELEKKKQQMIVLKESLSD